MSFGSAMHTQTISERKETEFYALEEKQIMPRKDTKVKVSPLGVAIGSLISVPEQRLSLRERDRR